MPDTEVLLDGLTFPEGPRWHDGRLWFSDFFSHRVIAVDLQGRAETIVEVPGQPSGLGWLPDGRLLVVSMTDRKLMRLEPGGLVEHADLSGVATFHCNDMVVDGDGRAYVGNFGSDYNTGEPLQPARLARVDPDGTVSVAAEGLMFPNGAVITPDGATLIIGETFARHLTAFDRGPGGSLSNRRVWADIAPHLPDGICLDAEGAVWSADPRGNVVIRVAEGGKILDQVSTGDLGAFACMLGGEDGRTLFICTCAGSGESVAAQRAGRIEVARVEVPHAGWP
ncbi:MAG: SMP-30/gluconolactonase/LRE family protein [Dehalococcoidia bacterium]